MEKLKELARKYVPGEVEFLAILSGNERFYNIAALATPNVEPKDLALKTSLLESLITRLWERIHTSRFSDIPISVRKSFAAASLYYVVYTLLEDMSRERLEFCCKALDRATLLGCTENLWPGSAILQVELMKLIDIELGVPSGIILRRVPFTPRVYSKQSISEVRNLSAFAFYLSFLLYQLPVIILDNIKCWPAFVKWRDLNYFLKIGGNRTVPIEVGSNYTATDWSQKLFKLHEFLSRQFSATTKQEDTDEPQVEYLAQHDLLDQISQLRADIYIPAYCKVRNPTKKVDIKAWLGPKNTVSPLHYDLKQNLLCQVFGTKQIILAGPEDTPYLYPHESKMLNNTSQLDLANLDFVKFPLACKAKFFHMILHEGDSLFIPKGWWHFVRAKTDSCSVSLWWDTDM